MTPNDLSVHTLRLIDQIMHKHALGLISPIDSVKMIKTIMADHVMEEAKLIQP